MVNVTDKKAIFCLLARDCESVISDNIKIIENMRSFFKQSYTLIVENDSIDNTVILLEKWQKSSDNIIIIHPESNQLNNLDRISRIAYCRNIYLNEAKKIAGKDGNIDFLIVIDLDLELKICDLSKIINCVPSDWAGIFANGRNYLSFFGIKIPYQYYDSFALIEFNSGKRQLTNRERYYLARKINFKLLFNEYISCDSAFGGIAIYKWKYICDKNYEIIKSKIPDYPIVCEHIQMNLNIISNENVKLYICSKLKLRHRKTKIRGAMVMISRNIFGYNLTEKMISFCFRKREK